MFDASTSSPDKPFTTSGAESESCTSANLHYLRRVLGIVMQHFWPWDWHCADPQGGKWVLNFLKQPNSKHDGCDMLKLSQEYCASYSGKNLVKGSIIPHRPASPWSLAASWAVCPWSTNFSATNRHHECHMQQLAVYKVKVKVAFSSITFPLASDNCSSPVRLLFPVMFSESSSLLEVPSALVPCRKHLSQDVPPCHVLNLWQT